MHRKRPNGIIFLLSLLIFVSIIQTACGNDVGAEKTASGDPKTVTIAYQTGLSVASLVVIKQRQTLEKQFPNTKIQWKVFSSGAAVREAVVANQAQFGYLGVPPFLVGWDRGVNWHILTGISQQDSWLVARDPKIKSLKDFKPGDKIGLPAPDSFQAIILRKEAQQQLGDAHALDKNLVAISHADGRQALLNGQLTAHLTSPPFGFQESNEGGHVILHSKDVFKDSSSDVFAVTDSFYKEYPNFSKKLKADIVEANGFISSNPVETSQYLSKEQAGKVKPEQLQAWLKEGAVVYDLEPKGLSDYATFMKSIGLLSKVPGADNELLVTN